MGKGVFKSIVLCIGIIFVMQFAAKAADFYVSPAGDDNNPGTLVKPFATINKAKEAVRELKKTKTDCGITVLIRGGTYKLDEPITFTPEDSGSAGSLIVYQACPNEVPILSGGKKIEGWRAVTEDINIVNPKARGKLWSAAIQPREQIGQLFIGDKMLQRSITPNTDEWLTWPKGKPGKENHEMILPNELIGHWPNPKDVQINFLPTINTKWLNRLYSVEKIDGNVVTLNRTVKGPGHIEEPSDDFPVRIENTLEGIDQPGEWCVDKVKNLIYFWPPENTDLKTAEVIAPLLNTAIILKGDQQQNKFVEHITIRGLVIQHASTGVNISAAQDCKIDGCRIQNLTNWAISAGTYAKRIAISNCKIAFCGNSGITFSGTYSDLKTFNCENTVCNNEIYKCGMINWNGTGIVFQFCGNNIIRQNYIHDMPYAGVIVGGSRFGIMLELKRQNHKGINWSDIADSEMTIYGFKKYVPGYNLVENNVIHDVMMQMDDGGAIYCHSSHYNMVRNNVVYRTHSKCSFGLYFDDDEMYSTMENNLVYECPIENSARGSSKYQGTTLYMHDNAKNYAYRNIAALTNKVLWLLNNYGGARIMDNIFVVKKNGIDPDKLPRNVGRYKDIRWDAGENMMDNNVYWCIDGNEAAREYLKKWQTKGWDKNSIVANPGFKDIGKRDFSFDTSSIAWQMGIRPIDTSKVGVQSDFAAVK